jgi:hypothetical protein
LLPAVDRRLSPQHLTCSSQIQSGLHMARQT